jgi:phosphoserine phosphatase
MDPKRNADLVLFDMDGTLTEVRSPWEHIHRELGLWTGNADRHLKAFLEKRIDYPEFFRRDMDMWIGVRREAIEGILDGIPIRLGVPETLRSLREAGVGLAILSTGFARVARRIEAACGFPIETLANEMTFDASGALEGGEMLVSGDEDSTISKEAFARSLMASAGALRCRTAAVGDSPGDRGVFRQAGITVAVREAVGLEAGVRLPERDLRCLLRVLL